MKFNLSKIVNDLQKLVDSDTNALLRTSSCDKTVRQTADALNRKLIALRKLQIRYMDGDKKLKDAITNVSHDLRTPLTVIYGYVEQLKNQITDEQLLKKVDMIHSRTKEMIDLTEELFRYTVIADTESEPKLERLNVNEILEESALGFYSAFAARGIEPVIDICDKPVFGVTDKQALSRIFSNIISNAIKYAKTDFSVTMTESGVITFSNTAPELNYVNVEQLLDRYYTVKNNNESTGLGLSIARMLADRCNCGISASYSDGRLSITVTVNDIARDGASEQTNNLIKQ